MYHSFDLEATILDILYQKCIERPLWVSDSEVYWLIPNMNVTERDVREVLEQLVFHRRVLKQVGKYQISKAEFLSIKERIEAREEQESSEQGMTECEPTEGTKTEQKTKDTASECNTLSISSSQKLWRVIIISLTVILLFSVGLLWYSNNEVKSRSSELIDSPFYNVSEEATSIQDTSVLEYNLNKDLDFLYRYLQQSDSTTHQSDSLQQAIIRTQGYILHQNQQLKEQVKCLRYCLIVGGVMFLLLCVLSIKRRKIFFHRNHQ